MFTPELIQTGAYSSPGDNSGKYGMSFNILNQVVEKIKKSTFGMYAIQLDETTDITNLAQLCIYVR